MPAVNAGGEGEDGRHGEHADGGEVEGRADAARLPRRLPLADAQVGRTRVEGVVQGEDVGVRATGAGQAGDQAGEPQRQRVARGLAGQARDREDDGQRKKSKEEAAV